VWGSFFGLPRDVLEGVALPLRRPFPVNRVRHPTPLRHNLVTLDFGGKSAVTLTFLTVIAQRAMLHS